MGPQGPQGQAGPANPAADGTGSLGTSNLRWGDVYAEEVTCDELILPVESTTVGGIVMQRTSGPSFRAYALATDSEADNAEQSAMLTLGLQYSKLGSLNDSPPNVDCGTAICAKLPDTDVDALNLTGHSYDFNGFSPQLRYIGWHQQGAHTFVLAWTPDCDPNGGNIAYKQWRCALIPLLVTRDNPYAEVRFNEGPALINNAEADWSWYSYASGTDALAGPLSVDVGNEIAWVGVGGTSDYMATIWAVDTEHNVWLHFCSQTILNATVNNPRAGGGPNCTQGFYPQTLPQMIGNKTVHVSSGGINPAWPALAGDNQELANRIGYGACNVALMTSDGEVFYGMQSGAAAYSYFPGTNRFAGMVDLCTWQRVNQTKNTKFVGVGVGYDIMLAADNTSSVRFIYQADYDPRQGVAGCTGMYCSVVKPPVWANWNRTTWPTSAGHPVYVDSYNASRSFVLDDQGDVWQFVPLAAEFEAVIYGDGVTTGPAAGTIAFMSAGPDALWVTDTAARVWRMMYTWNPATWVAETALNEAAYSAVRLGRDGVGVYSSVGSSQVLSDEQVAATEVARFTDHGTVLDSNAAQQVYTSGKGDLTVQGTLNAQGGLRLPDNTLSVGIVQATSNITAPVVSAGTTLEVGGGGLGRVQVLVNYKQLRAMTGSLSGTTDVIIVPFPPTGKSLHLLSVFFNLLYGGITYTVSSGDLELYYSDQSQGGGTRIGAIAALSGFLTSTQSTVTSPLPIALPGAVAGSYTNKAITLGLSASGQTVTNGNSNVTVTILYTYL